MTESVGEEFAAQEATAIISGDGVNKPRGILDTDPVTTADDASPMRAADVIQYIGITSPASPTVLTADTLVDVAVGSLKERYLMDSDSVAWVMSRGTLATVRKLKDQNDQYLWQPSLAAGQPSSLLGYPVFTCDAMPAIAADAFLILFGNFRRGYLLVERFNSLRILVNPYSTIGQISYYVRKREGGLVYNNDSLRAIRISD